MRTVLTTAKKDEQEAQLMLSNPRVAFLEVSQGHKTWYHSIC